MYSSPASDTSEFIRKCMEKYRKVTATNIIDAFSHVVHANPNRVAVRFKDSYLTYKQLDNLSNCVARGLLDEGIKPRSTVGICLNKSHRFVVSIMGVLKAGCAYLPLSKLYPQKRVEDIISLSGMSGLIAESDDQTRYKYANRLDYDELIRTDCFELPDIKTDHNDLAYIIFTSGSTGIPKGIAVRHSNVISLIYAIQHDLFDEDAANPRNISLIAPFTFDMSVCQMYCALLFGKTLIIFEDEKKNSMEYIVECLNGNSVDLADMTPVLLKMFIDHAERCHPPLILPQHFIISGEALPMILLKRFYSLRNSDHTRIYNAYGPTETCVYATAHTFNKQNINQYDKMTVGKPLTNTEVYILDEKLNRCGCNTEGEIYVSGPNVSAGYINQPELTKKVFIPDIFREGRIMYKTGDLGCYMEDGTIECHGRVDDQVKLRGYRIELGDIAKHIENIKGVTQCVARMQENENERFVVAYYTHTEDLALERIQKELGENIPNYMMPSYYVPVDRFRLGLSGKIDKSSLPDYKTNCLRAVDRQNRYAFDESELDPIQREFLSLCKQVFGRDDISLNDSFVDLGGSSLTIHILLMKIWQRLGRLINVAAFYKCSTLYEMSVCLITGKTQEAEQEACSGYELPAETEVTSIQQDMFDLKQAADVREFNKKKTNNSSFHVIHIIHVNEHIDYERLEYALSKLIQRHNAFRITFSRNGSRWRMHLHEKNDCCVIKYLHTNVPITRELLLENTMRFDEASLPLFKLILFEDPSGRQMMLLNAHHAIFDFISLQIFLTDLFAFYDNNGLSHLNRGFFDYAFSEAKEAVRRNRTFWKEYTKGRFRAAAFSKDEPAFTQLSITETNVFDSVYNAINGEMLDKIRKSAVAYNATPYTILIALLALYMRIKSGCHDIIIGTNLNGRETAHDFEMIGMFTSQACVRLLIDDSYNFSDYIAKCKENISEIMKHQSISLSDIYKSQYMADMAKGALYHVFVNYFPINSIDLYRGGERVAVEILDEDPGFCPFELKFIEEDDKIRVEAKYLNEVYSKGEAIKITADYFELVNHFADLPWPGTSLQTFMEGVKIDGSYS